VEHESGTSLELLRLLMLAAVLFCGGDDRCAHREQLGGRRDRVIRFRQVGDANADSTARRA